MGVDDPLEQLCPFDEQVDAIGRDRDLAGHEQTPEARPSPDGPAAVFPEGRRQAAVRGVQRGRQPGEDRAEERDREGEDEHASIEGDTIEIREESEDSFDVPYQIRKGYYYRVNVKVSRGIEVRPTIMQLKDYTATAKSLSLRCLTPRLAWGWTRR